MSQTLGRCARGHVNIVEYSGEMPSGLCRQCNRPLVEWMKRVIDKVVGA